MDSFEVPVQFVTAKEAREMSDASDAAFNRLMIKIDTHIRIVAATGERELSIPTVIQGRERGDYPELCPFNSEKPTRIQGRLLKALLCAGYGVTPPADNTTHFIVRW
jgi:hypothetical protein